MKEEKKKSANIEEVNDENPDNFTRYGNGHKLKVEEKYTDGEPPHEDDEPYADPDHPNEGIKKTLYP